MRTRECLLTCVDAGLRASELLVSSPRFSTKAGGFVGRSASIASSGERAASVQPGALHSYRPLNGQGWVSRFHGNQVNRENRGARCRALDGLHKGSAASAATGRYPPRGQALGRRRSAPESSHTHTPGPQYSMSVHRRTGRPEDPTSAKAGQTSGSLLPTHVVPSPTQPTTPRGSTDSGEDVLRDAMSRMCPP